MKTLFWLAMLVGAISLAWIAVRGDSSFGTPVDAGIGIGTALIALLLFWRSAQDARARQLERGSPGPDMLQSITIWVFIITIIVVLYNGARFWTNLGALFK